MWSQQKPWSYFVDQGNLVVLLNIRIGTRLLFYFRRVFNNFCHFHETDPLVLLSILPIPGATVVSWRVNNQEQLFVRYVRVTAAGQRVQMSIRFAFLPNDQRVALRNSASSDSNWSTFEKRPSWLRCSGDGRWSNHFRERIGGVLQSPLCSYNTLCLKKTHRFL